jgi:hypothetical protein
VETTDDPRERYRIFHLNYGITLGEWALLEDALCELFQRLAVIRPKLARAMFYSGRSFATRADLFSAALEAAAAPESYKAACKATLKRARQYSSARNTIAHGIPVDMRHSTEEGLHRYRVKQGRSIMEAGGVTQGQMQAAAIYFRGLQEIIWRIALTPFDEQEAIVRCHEQVLQLPNEALPLEEDPIIEEGE